MFGILANNADNPIPLDNFAFVANRFNTRPDFHPFPLINSGLAAALSWLILPDDAFSSVLLSGSLYQGQRRP